MWLAFRSGTAALSPSGGRGREGQRGEGRKRTSNSFFGKTGSIREEGDVYYLPKVISMGGGEGGQ